MNRVYHTQMDTTLWRVAQFIEVDDFSPVSLLDVVTRFHINQVDANKGMAYTSIRFHLICFVNYDTQQQPCKHKKNKKLVLQVSALTRWMWIRGWGTQAPGFTDHFRELWYTTATLETLETSTNVSSFHINDVDVNKGIAYMRIRFHLICFVNYDTQQQPCKHNKLNWKDQPPSVQQR